MKNTEAGQISQLTPQFTQKGSARVPGSRFVLSATFVGKPPPYRAVWLWHGGQLGGTDTD
jgi:hypothetical protein